MMNSQVKVSVFMITYNHAPYIAKALDSALMQQTNFPIEIIVGEDCSTDATRQILCDIATRNADRVRPVLQARNVGTGQNAMDVINACNGEYIAMLEGDDYWTDACKLQKQVDALESHPSWSGCFHPVPFVDENDQPLNKMHPSEPKTEITFSDLCSKNDIQFCSLMARRAALPGLGDWFADVMPGDWPMCLLMATHGPIGYLPETMGRYRVHQGGVWTAKKHADRVAAVAKTFDILARHIEEPWRTKVIEFRRRFVKEQTPTLVGKVLQGIKGKFTGTAKVS